MGIAGGLVEMAIFVVVLAVVRLRMEERSPGVELTGPEDVAGQDAALRSGFVSPTG